MSLLDRILSVLGVILYSLVGGFFGFYIGAFYERDYKNKDKEEDNSDDI